MPNERSMASVSGLSPPSACAAAAAPGPPPAAPPPAPPACAMKAPPPPGSWKRRTPGPPPGGAPRKKGRAASGPSAASSGSKSRGSSAAVPSSGICTGWRVSWRASGRGEGRVGLRGGRTSSTKSPRHSGQTIPSALEGKLSPSYWHSWQKWRMAWWRAREREAVLSLRFHHRRQLGSSPCWHEHSYKAAYAAQGSRSSKAASPHEGGDLPLLRPLVSHPPSRLSRPVPLARAWQCSVVLLRAHAEGVDLLRATCEARTLRPPSPRSDLPPAGRCTARDSRLSSTWLRLARQKCTSPRSPSFYPSCLRRAR